MTLPKQALIITSSKPFFKWNLLSVSKVYNWKLWFFTVLSQCINFAKEDLLWIGRGNMWTMNDQTSRHMCNLPAFIMPKFDRSHRTQKDHVQLHLLLMSKDKSKEPNSNITCMKVTMQKENMLEDKGDG